MVGNDEFRIVAEDVAETFAFGTGADRMVEGKEDRPQRFKGTSALLAEKIGAEGVSPVADHVDRTAAFPLAERGLNRFDEALSDLNYAIKLKPESAQFVHARGLIYQRQGLWQQAINDFDAAIDRNPFVAAPYLARGQCLTQLNKLDSALEDFNASLNINNRNADADRKSTRLNSSH